MTSTALAATKAGDVIRFRPVGDRNRVTIRLDSAPRSACDGRAFAVTGYRAKWNADYGFVTYGRWTYELVTQYTADVEVLRAASAV